MRFLEFFTRRGIGDWHITLTVTTSQRVVPSRASTNTRDGMATVPDNTNSISKTGLLLVSFGSRTNHIYSHQGIVEGASRVREPPRRVV